MKILVLSPRLPHARVAGGHIIVHQRIQRLLGRGHQVGVACFGGEDRPEEEAAVREVVADLVMLPRPRRGAFRARINSLLPGAPPPYFQHLRSREFARAVGDLAERGTYDLILAEFSAMGQYVYRNPFLPAVRRVVSCHFSAATSYRKVADLLRYSPRGIGSRLGLGGLLRYEIDMYRNADRVLVLTAEERHALLDYSPDLRVTVIPPGVDTRAYAPAALPAGGPPVILFVGHYEIEANRDAAAWFARSIWPRLRDHHPEARFEIVGPRPPPAIRALATRTSRVVVTGEVPDVRDRLAAASVFVCPVRLGSGLRVKLLEAMAAGVPVVSTTLGTDGIPACNGEHLLVADTPEMMAREVELLLDDAELRGRLSRAGRALVRERFAWDRTIAMLEQTLRAVMRQP